MQASGVPPWLPLNDAIQLLHEDPLADSLASHPDVSDEGAEPQSKCPRRSGV